MERIRIDRMDVSVRVEEGYAGAIVVVSSTEADVADDLRDAEQRRCCRTILAVAHGLAIRVALCDDVDPSLVSGPGDVGESIDFGSDPVATKRRTYRLIVRVRCDHRMSAKTTEIVKKIADDFVRECRE